MKLQIFEIAERRQKMNRFLMKKKASPYGKEEEKQNIAFTKATVLPVRKDKVSIKKESFRLCDPEADNAVKDLAAFLKGVCSSPYLMYGHQNDLQRKAGPHHKPFSCSDTFDVTGEYAAVTGLDVLTLTGVEHARFYWNRKDRIQSCVDLAMKSIRNGAVLSLSAHMPNFQLIWEWKNGITAVPELHHFEDKKREKLINGGYNTWPVELKDGATNFYGYTPNDLRGSVMQEILEGGKLNPLYTEYLDLVCDFCLALERKNVALMWRPFHENSGGWFWWGCKTCTPEEFKAVWQYTYRYFTEKRGVHNLIWCYSPGSEYHSVEEYESRYPGDEYVDLLGFDMYQQWPGQGNAFWEAYDQQCKMVSEAAARHQKLFANTETGIMHPDGKALLNNGNEDFEWYEKIAAICRKYHAAYFLLWANFWAGGSYYTPYLSKIKKSHGKITELEGHEMLDSFIRFYNDPNILFSGEIRQ